jgi:protein-tyrosine phosphatase
MRHKPASHTLAIHCRGGKGRTGSMCCAWLLYSRACLDADDALTHFALERTELSLGKKKIQVR